MAQVKQMVLAGIAAGAMFAAAISSANAADMDFAPAPTAYGYDWSGFYLGVAGGYLGAETKNHGDYDVYDFLSVDYFTGGGKTNLKPEGGIFGGYAGYNWQIAGSGFILGIDADIYGATAKDSKHITNYGYWLVGDELVLGDLRAKQKISSTWAVRGRAGWAIESFMAYVAGGYAGASMKTSVSDFNIYGPGSQSKSHTYTGWTVGGGLDFLVTPNWTMGLDYQYKDLGKKTANFGGYYPDEYDVDLRVRTKLTTNQFTVRGGYKF